MKRDLIGYGTTPPKVEWPNGACLAVSLVVNYEEGAEFGADQGDPINERIAEIHSPVGNGVRDLGREQMFNYGLRAGLWRILDALDRHRRKATFYMCARAVERTPGLAAEVVRRGHEPALHSYRWANHVLFTDEEAERQLIERCVEAIRSATAERPQRLLCPLGPGPEHAAAPAGGGRLRLQLEQLRRRPALLRLRPAAGADARHSLCARYQ